MRPTRITFFLLLAALGAAGAPPAQAVGSRIDVQIVDRTTGETLPAYEHGGEWWVAGRPGATYRVDLRNRDGRRLLGVLSIDGVNAITGDTAAWNQTGYVLDPYRQFGVSGWRKNMAQVAAFEFADLPDSYAARTGRPGNVGVIGVAVFEERPVVVPIARNEPVPDAAKAAPQPAPAPRADSSGASSTVAPAPAAPAPSSTADAGRQLARSAAPSSERLGTGHGAIEESVIRHVAFQRAQATPSEIVTIHYDRMENLVAMGIVAAPIAAVAANPPVDPFPGSHRYVPDPPLRR
jgi:hypothetical protein